MANLTNQSDSLDEPKIPDGTQTGLTAVLLATGLGIGLKMPAPGTFGALWGIPLWLGLQQLPSIGWQISVLSAIFLVGIAVCTKAAKELLIRGWSKSGKDPQSIVIDEYATVPIVYAFSPSATTGSLTDTILWWVLGFALHRLFDISKPWPCRKLEQLPEGLGIMSDDLVAAIYGGLCFWGCYWAVGAIF